MYLLWVVIIQLSGPLGGGGCDGDLMVVVVMTLGGGGRSVGFNRYIVYHFLKRLLFILVMDSGTFCKLVICTGFGLIPGDFVLIFIIQNFR